MLGGTEGEATSASVTTGPQGWPLPNLSLAGKGLQDVGAVVLGPHAHVHGAGEQRDKRQGGSDSHPHEAKVRNGRHQNPSSTSF